MPKIGQFVAHFKIQAKLASGSMSVVHKAKDAKFNCAVTLRFPLKNKSRSRSMPKRGQLSSRTATVRGHDENPIVGPVSRRSWIRKAIDGLIFIVLIGLGASAAAQSPTPCLRITSSNFEVLTTAGEETGRDVALRFEQIRQLFLKETRANEGRLLPFRVPIDFSGSALTWFSELPLRIIVFGSEKEFRPYKFTAATLAYLTRGFNREYIVMSRSSSESFSLAVHEYLHLLLRYSGADLPLWANEGMAELYSTLKPIGREIELGARIPELSRVMQRRSLLDLKTLFAVQRFAPLQAVVSLRNLLRPELGSGAHAEPVEGIHPVSIRRFPRISGFR